MLAATALAVLLTWAMVAMVLIGAGSLVLRRFESDFALVDAFWMGLAVSSLRRQTLHEIRKLLKSE